MAVKNNRKPEQKEQNKSEVTSKQKAAERQERTRNIPPLEQRSATPKQDALNEALANTAGSIAGNMAANAAIDVVGGDNPALGTLMQQYAQRADRQYGAPRETIAPGSINPNVDTVYRVGADDPYGYYSQAQLNNNMSGNDANAIYQATHDQTNPWGYGAAYYGDRYNRYETPQEHNIRLRGEGYLPDTSRQLSMPVEGDVAYVSGADAWSNANYDDILPAGVGSIQGIPREFLNGYEKYLSDLDRSGDWYDRRTETIKNWMDRDRLDRWNSGRGKNW